VKSQDSPWPGLQPAIGIGINTAVFSNMDAVVLIRWPCRSWTRVTVAEQNAQLSSSNGYEWVALANYQDWARQSRSFESLAVRTTPIRP